MTDPTALYDRALLLWGQDAQIRKTCEELTELQLALLHRLDGRRTAENLNDIACEIADVRIMVEQVERMFGLALMAKHARGCKLSRLAGRIADAEATRNGVQS